MQALNQLLFYPFDLKNPSHLQLLTCVKKSTQVISHGKTKRRSSKRSRDKELKIRFSEEEYQTIKKKAGTKSMATYMRQQCLADNSQPMHSSSRYQDTPLPPKINPNLFRVLVGAGNNLNQIARLLNRQNAAGKSLSIAWAAMELVQIKVMLDGIEHAYTAKKTRRHNKDAAESMDVNSSPES